MSSGCKSAGGGPVPFSFLSLFLPPTPNPLINDRKPTHCAGRVCLSNHHHFYFTLINISLFKNRGVAMGKPHCNYSICNFGSCTRFNVNFAYAEFHSWLLISMN